MIVGCPKEVKALEGRVGLTPSGVLELVRCKHVVIVETKAGEKSGFSDEEYVKAGATIIKTAAEVYEKADMIVKVKEPLECEFNLIRPGQIVFTYFHFASGKALLDAMLKRGAICVAYETVEVNRRLPLLEPMSEIAGKMAIQVGMRFLESAEGGRGLLIGGVPGVKPGKVVIIGGGVVGANAAKVAAGCGAECVIFDKSLERLRYLDDILPKNVSCRYSCEDAILEEIKTADMVIGAVLLPGLATPRIIRREHLKLMKPGSVIVDVAVDRGGCIETTKATYHDKPTFVVDGVTHYCVANMPGSVPISSTMALTNATIGFALELANKGWKESCAKNAGLKGGLCVANGALLHKGLAEQFGMPCANANEVLGIKY